MSVCVYALTGCVQHGCLLEDTLFRKWKHAALWSLRYQRYSTTQTPHNSERQREKQKGLVKQTFELDEAAIDRQDEQVQQ